MTNLKKLRERRIVQILLAYGAAALVLMQVAGQLIDRGILPDFVFPLVLAWCLAGLVAAGTIGWFHGERGAQKAPPAEIAILALLGLAAVGYTANLLLDQRGAPREAATNTLALDRIAVRDLEDRSSDGSLAALADDLTEGLIRDLGRVRGLDVVGGDEVAAFADPSIPVDSLARGVGAGTVLVGFLEATPEGVQVQMQLVDGISGVVVDRVAFEAAADPRPPLENELADRVARLLAIWLEEDIEVPRRSP